MGTRLVKYTLPYESAIHYGMLDEFNRVTEVENFFYPGVNLGTSIPLAHVKLLPPLPGTPSKIIAVGMNYPAHIDEMKHTDVPEDPVLFLKAPSTLIATGQPIVASEALGRVDFEGELAVVIGQTCKSVSEPEALSYVLGYTIANDVTAREMQRRDKQWGRAKNFDTFCPVGPALLLSNGQPPETFRIRTFVNDECVQDASVSEMRFSIPFLIAYISDIMTLNPGDMILTGTPQGVRPLKDGEQVRIEVAEIGTLENPYQVKSATPVS